MLKITALGAVVVQLVERVPVYRGCVFAAAAPGSIPSSGPFLHIFPFLSLSVSLSLPFFVKSFSCPVKKPKNYFRKTALNCCKCRKITAEKKLFVLRGNITIFKFHIGRY